MSMTNREIEKYVDAFKYWCDTNEENGVITLPKFLCEHIVEILDDAKARPHGEWIDLSDGWQEGTYECSNCKTEFVLIEGTPEDNEYNFCPNCGADMRKRGEEE
ncbi:MAG: hypothetical protein J6T10_25430 [Methanobrevibacter sp.]|nr:hypothetical protein [Methanobrevibacter sp.]